MMPLAEKKKELRGRVLSKRLQIKKDEWRLKSEQIQKHITESSFYQQAGFIHCFISMNERNEVNTWNLISYMLADDKKVVVPVTNFSDSSLVHSALTNVEELKPNKWGIHEPETIINADIKLLDLVMVPMAAADVKGNRLGYGKGFYDRFLSEITALKIGLVFNSFIYDEIPAEDFDIRMDAIVSEKGIIYTKQ